MEILMKKVYFLLLFIFCMLILFATPEITFKEPIYDFGDVYEKDGPVEHEFEFTNTGDEPLELKRVKAS